ncbi:mechanosensitive ion channel family protein [Phaeobacter gallaeciensis]|uniref:Small-conductance mechanosensitive channel n=1 Tax=Phaeobacter gallaeciensis TaxID=60890 RepID=A0AAC9ZB33_9RHOB|nr:mechanosensitive ion channel family protein [Phaeobacter gallaeciensis]AHD10999.1 Small-conductance mechanosensitive channel [Phaeobacter gallaeciensis DSM 26640]ATE94262.1 Small-conductance mechanosensitive channel [Phaeobacter gallaeciensis]ATE95917.1 Small-conductance mechanosensitive channel [Phaeobacter gallaeciensis]ATF02926.1 Small-conductance mechanosensitive channel [Phaeobacter gallaeciensis]ATF07306.1 Small-conductance mechanosensitive channel [Phaeobacter gallaeciensis]
MPVTEDLSLTLMEQISGWVASAVTAAPRVGVALAILLLTALLVWLAKTVIRRISRQLKLRRNLCDVLQLLASVVLWLIGSLIAVTVVFPTVTPGKALTTLGLGSVAIGFAFKDTFENFLAGILLLLREPFQIGDFIECEGAEGKIEAITVRDTHIRQTDGQLVVVPNAQLFHNAVTVRTNKELRRATLICGIAYGESVDTARSVISEAVRNVDMVRDDVRDVQVFAKTFSASSVDFEITWWTGSEPLDIRASRDQVVAAVKSALDDAGIEIPFPYRTLTVNEPIPVQIDSQNNTPMASANHGSRRD